MREPPRILLKHWLKTLRSPTFLREYEKVARKSAPEGLVHTQFFSRLVELELIDRERRLVEWRIKAAKFPTVPSLDRTLGAVLSRNPETPDPSRTGLDQPADPGEKVRTCSVDANRRCLNVVDRFRAASQ